MTTSSITNAQSPSWRIKFRDPEISRNFVSGYARGVVRLPNDVNLMITQYISRHFHLMHQKQSKLTLHSDQTLRDIADCVEDGARIWIHFSVARPIFSAFRSANDKDDRWVELPADFNCATLYTLELLQMHQNLDADLELHIGRVGPDLLHVGPPDDEADDHLDVVDPRSLRVGDIIDVYCEKWSGWSEAVVTQSSSTMYTLNLFVHSIGSHYKDDLWISTCDRTATRANVSDEELRRMRRSGDVEEKYDYCLARRGTQSKTREFAHEFKSKGISAGYQNLESLYDPCRECHILLENSSNPDQWFKFVSDPLSEFRHVTLYRVAADFMPEIDDLDGFEVWEDLTVISSDGLFSFVTPCRQLLAIEQCEKFEIRTLLPLNPWQRFEMCLDAYYQE